MSSRFFLARGNLSSKLWRRVPQTADKFGLPSSTPKLRLLLSETGNTQEIFKEAERRGLKSRGVDIEYGESNNMSQPYGLLLLGWKDCHSRLAHPYFSNHKTASPM